MAYNGVNSSGKHEYEYVRVKLTSGWDNPENPARLDGGGLQIHLSTEIEAALPGKPFCFHAYGTKTLIWFGSQLTAGEEASLDQAVSDHKNNV